MYSKSSSSRKVDYVVSPAKADAHPDSLNDSIKIDFKTGVEKVGSMEAYLTPTNNPREVIIEHGPRDRTGPTSCKKLLPNNNQICLYTFKIVLGIITILLIFIMKNLAVPDNKVPSVTDNLMNVFEGVNQTIRDGGFLAKFLAILSSILLDIAFIAIAVYWILYGKNSRPIIAAILFFTYRAIVLSLFTFPYPENYYWEYPGMPSLISVYGRHSDFFPSGQIGFLVIAALEWVNFGKKKIAALYFLLGVLISFVFMAFRTSYSIDIIAGAVVAHWLYILVGKFYNVIDDLLIILHMKYLSRKKALSGENTPTARDPDISIA